MIFFDVKDTLELFSPTIPLCVVRLINKSTMLSVSTADTRALRKILCFLNNHKDHFKVVEMEGRKAWNEQVPIENRHQHTRLLLRAKCSYMFHISIIDSHQLQRIYRIVISIRVTNLLTNRERLPLCHWR